MAGSLYNDAGSMLNQAAREAAYSAEGQRAEQMRRQQEELERLQDEETRSAVPEGYGMDGFYEGREREDAERTAEVREQDSRQFPESAAVESEPVPDVGDSMSVGRIIEPVKGYGKTLGEPVSGAGFAGSSEKQPEKQLDELQDEKQGLPEAGKSLVGPEDGKVPDGPSVGATYDLASGRQYEMGAHETSSPEISGPQDGLLPEVGGPDGAGPAVPESAPDVPEQQVEPDAAAVAAARAEADARIKEAQARAAAVEKQNAQREAMIQSREADRIGRATDRSLALGMGASLSQVGTMASRAGHYETVEASANAEVQQAMAAYDAVRTPEQEAAYQEDLESGTQLGYDGPSYG